MSCVARCHVVRWCVMPCDGVRKICVVGCVHLRMFRSAVLLDLALGVRHGGGVHGQGTVELQHADA